MLAAAALIIGVLLVAAPGWASALAGRVDCTVRAVVGKETDGTSCGATTAARNATTSVTPAATAGTTETPTRIARTYGAVPLERTTDSASDWCTPAVAGLPAVADRLSPGELGSLCVTNGGDIIGCGISPEQVAINAQDGTSPESGMACGDVPLARNGLTCGKDPNVDRFLCHAPRPPDGSTPPPMECRGDPSDPAFVVGCRIVESFPARPWTPAADVCTKLGRPVVAVGGGDAQLYACVEPSGLVKRCADGIEIASGGLEAVSLGPESCDFTAFDAGQLACDPANPETNIAVCHAGPYPADCVWLPAHPRPLACKLRGDPEETECSATDAPPGGRGRGLQQLSLPTLQQARTGRRPPFAPGDVPSGVLIWETPTFSSAPSDPIASRLAYLPGGLEDSLGDPTGFPLERMRAIAKVVGGGLDYGFTWFGINGIDDRGLGIGVEWARDRSSGSCHQMISPDPDSPTNAEWLEIADRKGQGESAALLHELGHAYVHRLGVIRGGRAGLPEADALDEGFADIFARAGKFALGLPSPGVLETGPLGPDRSLEANLITNRAGWVGKPHTDGGLAVHIFNTLAQRLNGTPGLTLNRGTRAGASATALNVSRAALLQGAAMKRMAQEPPQAPHARASFMNWCFKTVAAARAVGVGPKLVLRTFADAGFDCRRSEDQPTLTAGLTNCLTFAALLGIRQQGCRGAGLAPP